MEVRKKKCVNCFFSVSITIDENVNFKLFYDELDNFSYEDSEDANFSYDDLTNENETDGYFVRNLVVETMGRFFNEKRNFFHK